MSQIEKDKYCMIALICGIQKIQQTSEYNKKKQIHRQSERVVASEGREGAIQVWDWEAQTSGSKFGSRMYNMGNTADIL